MGWWCHFHSHSLRDDDRDYVGDAQVAQAYVAALQKAKRVDTIPTTPETFVERIREKRSITMVYTRSADRLIDLTSILGVNV
jgi:hypothetical protein